MALHLLLKNRFHVPGLLFDAASRNGRRKVDATGNTALDGEAPTSSPGGRSGARPVARNRRRWLVADLLGARSPWEPRH